MLYLYGMWVWVVLACAGKEVVASVYTRSVSSEIANNGWQFHSEFVLFALVILNIIMTVVLEEFGLERMEVSCG